MKYTIMKTYEEISQELRGFTREMIEEILEKRARNGYENFLIRRYYYNTYIRDKWQNLPIIDRDLYKILSSEYK